MPGSLTGVLGLHCWDAEEFGEDEIGQNPHHAQNVCYARRWEQGVLTGSDNQRKLFTFTLRSSDPIIQS